MALIGFEGMDDTANAWGTPTLDGPPFGLTGINTAWIGGLAKTTALLGGFAAISNAGGTGKLQLQTNYTTAIVGVRFRNGLNFGSIQNVMTFMDGTTDQCGLSVNTSGKLFFWTGTTATVKGTGTTTLVLASWYFIEVKITINNATGVMECRLNAVAEPNLTLASQDTQTSANAQFNVIDFRISATQNLIDDIYMCDTTGPAPYNDFLGIIRVETLYPTSNNSVTWTPNASTNVTRVQEATMDSDTSYNVSLASGDIDTFNHGALSSTPVTIFAVQVRVCVKKDDVSNQNVRTKLISGATTQNGASQSVATVYQRSIDVYQTDPDTGLAWTAAGVNNSKIGYEHI